MLRDDICEFVSFPGCKNLNGMVEKAREREIELELCTKRKPEQVHVTVGQAKKPKTSDFSSRGQQGRDRCAKCDRPHSGVSRVSRSGCYMCG